MIQFLIDVRFAGSVVRGVLLTGCTAKLAGQSLRMCTVWRTRARVRVRTRGDSFLIIYGFVARNNAGLRLRIPVCRLGGRRDPPAPRVAAGAGQCFPFVKSRKNPCFFVAPHGISGMLMQPRSL